MTKHCPSGVLCIENFTFLFFALLIIAILIFMYIKYNSNLKNESIVNKSLLNTDLKYNVLYNLNNTKNDVLIRSVYSTIKR